jgi:hypothetical protein
MAGQRRRPAALRRDLVRQRPARLQLAAGDNDLRAARGETMRHRAAEPAAKPCAIARPSPRLPPVIMTTRSVKSNRASIVGRFLAALGRRVAGPLAIFNEDCSHIVCMLIS